jgi:hypothetical protein
MIEKKMVKSFTKLVKENKQKNKEFQNAYKGKQQLKPKVRGKS